MPATTVARWFGDADRPLLGWVTTPDGRATTSGVVVVAPVGYEWWATHATLRLLAERLAERGLTVLRYDHDGTGDSAGRPTDPDRFAAWRSGIGRAAAELRRVGVTDVALAGIDSGALLALLEAPAVEPVAVAAWAPPASGRHWARRLRLFGQPVPDGVAGAGALTAAGIVYTEQTFADIGAVKLPGDEPRQHRTLLLAPVEGALDRLAAALRDAGSDVTVATLGGCADLLEMPAEDVVPPQPAIATVAGWLADTLPPPAPVGTEPLPAVADAVVDGGAGPVGETVLTVGPRRLVGVQSAPVGGAEPGAATLVLLNSGSEPHVGPGRTWVDLGRSLAARGHRVIRLDMRGWGESPDDGRRPGRPYDAQGIADAGDAIAALRPMGPLAIGGLCAGAWTALQAATTEPPDAIFAINPQLYFRVGDPVEALLTDTRRRRAPERRREELGARWRLWTALDVLGVRPPAARRLAALRRAGVRVQLVFAQDDDGIEWLHNRMSRRLRHELRRGAHRLREIPGIDHQMYRYWLRPAVVDAADELLRSLTSAQASARSTSSQMV